MYIHVCVGGGVFVYIYIYIHLYVDVCVYLHLSISIYGAVQLECETVIGHRHFVRTLRKQRNSYAFGVRRRRRRRVCRKRRWYRSGTGGRHDG